MGASLKHHSLPRVQTPNIPLEAQLGNYIKVKPNLPNRQEIGDEDICPWTSKVDLK